MSTKGTISLVEKDEVNFHLYDESNDGKIYIDIWTPEHGTIKTVIPPETFKDILRNYLCKRYARTGTTFKKEIP